MASVTLTKHDFDVLQKIKDPEFDPSAGALLDTSLSRDPHIRDSEVYERIIRKERYILLSLQQVELEVAGLSPGKEGDLASKHRACVDSLSQLIEEFPKYASAKNNRAQALRRLYGDSMLVFNARGASQGIVTNAEEDEIKAAAATTLMDLDDAISLLSPETPFMALSPQQARTLALAYTQRAAIYHETAKRFSDGSLRVAESRKEKGWDRLQFEGAASRDFASGGWYGCDIAKNLAVSTNPTAKLCGQMVREAMKQEYGPDYGH